MRVCLQSVCVLMLNTPYHIWLSDFKSFGLFALKKPFCFEKMFLLQQVSEWTLKGRVLCC